MGRSEIHKEIARRICRLYPLACKKCDIESLYIPCHFYNDADGVMAYLESIGYSFTMPKEVLPLRSWEKESDGN